MPKLQPKVSEEVELKRKLVLLRITQELIRNSGEKEIFQLRKILKQDLMQKINKEPAQEKIEISPAPIISLQYPPKQEIIFSEEEKEIKPFEQKQTTQPLVHSKTKEISELKPKINPALNSTKYLSPQFALPQIKIPETRLPTNFEYLKPSPTEEEIDLKKLNILIKDPLVKMIECTGAQQGIIVSGGMGRKPTNIKLSNQEIKEILEAFSSAAKIPLSKGVFKIAFGKLILSAIVSDVVDSKFIIKKMETPMPQNNLRNLKK